MTRRLVSTTQRVSVRPRVVVELELEELPRVWIVAATLEDELRLRRSLAHPATARRLRDAIADVLEELAS